MELKKLEDPVQVYLSDVCTLPIGMQIIGKPFSEEATIKIAYAYEQATEWHMRRAEV